KQPDWSLLGLDGVNNLPAVRWKLINLQKIPDEKHQQALQQLKVVLNLTP
ncbi:MAG: nucleotidyl transferase AbiEii/AbiGii toxin family protein, partial [Cellvibrio sp.]|nr:nucleotidyl transferase AbiEii/AbiGii toxin family protein [Cellvibrio sp.]